MSKAMAVVLGDLTREQARRAVLSLMAMGLEAEAHFEPAVFSLAHDPALPGEAATPRARRLVSAAGWQVRVTEDDMAAAIPIVEETLSAEETAPERPLPSVLIHPPEGIWTLANSAASIAIAATCVAVHLLVHGGAGPSPRSDMVAAGAVAPWLVLEGEVWRLLSAVFLHFDVKHLVGNMGSLFFLGPPLAAQIGQIRTLVLFAATGVAGNVASQLLGSEAAVKAGASGGICGLLGALAGVALVSMAAAEDARQRRPAWQTLGALVALFGMIVGFEPGRDHYAHVGGLVAGVVLGRMMAPRREPG
ncbi:MAG: rhomboid family intramembrane serine protease [Candidatus Binatia bacterium]